jgi:hypothetical protein
MQLFHDTQGITAKDAITVIRVVLSVAVSTKHIAFLGNSFYVRSSLRGYEGGSTPSYPQIVSPSSLFFTQETSTLFNIVYLEVTPIDASEGIAWK